MMTPVKINPQPNSYPNPPKASYAPTAKVTPAHRSPQTKSGRINKQTTPSLKHLSPKKIVFTYPVKPARVALFVAALDDCEDVPPPDMGDAIDYFVTLPKWSTAIPIGELNFGYKKQNLTTYFNENEWKKFMDDVNIAASPKIGFVESLLWLLIFPLRIVLALFLKLTCIEKLLNYKYRIHAWEKLTLPLKITRSEEGILCLLRELNLSNKQNLVFSHERPRPSIPLEGIHGQPARIHLFLKKDPKDRTVRTSDDSRVKNVIAVESLDVCYNSMEKTVIAVESLDV